MKRIKLSPGAQRATGIIAFILLIFFTGRPVCAQTVTVSGAVQGNGVYPDLGGAFAAINGGSQSAANITVSLEGITTETATAQLNSNSWTSLLVVPAGGGLSVVSGSLAAPLVELNGVSNVRIDGLNTGGNMLAFMNSHTGNSNVSTIRLVNGAVSNTISNAGILGASTSATLGTVLFSTAGSSNGNSNNVISSCTIQPALTGNPIHAIYSAGTATLANSGNIIQNNDISDYFSAGVATNGIYLNTGSDAWMISGNRLFQTATRTYTSAQTHRGIYVNAGSGHNIVNNIIGYASAAQTGTTAMTATVAIRYIAIHVAATTATACSIQGNTVSGISYTTTSTANTQNGALCAINITGGSTDIGTVSGNIIGGVTGTDHLFLQGGTQGGIVGINLASTGTFAVHNNYIGGCTATGTTAAASGAFYGVLASSAVPALSVSGNTIGNPVADNLRAGTSGLTTGSSLFAAIYLPGITGGTTSVTNNLIRNGASYGTGTAGTLRGVWATTGNGPTYIVTGNTITNMVTNNGNVSLTDGQMGTVGVVLAGGTSNVISNNMISQIANTTTLTTAIPVGGISIANGPHPTVSFNTINGLSNLGTSTTSTGPAQATGIFIRSSTSGSVEIYNNMISLGNGQSSNTSFIGIHGFFLSNPAITRIWHNTINITGTAGGGAQPSFGVYRGDWTATAKTAAMDIRNNLITNTRTGGTGPHYAIANNYGVATSSGTGWFSDFNVLNAAPNTVGYWSGNVSFSAWQLASGGDANSFSGIPVTYVNAANDLHLNMGTTATQIESGAQLIASVTVDIDNQVRPGPSGSANGGAFTPDIGADEFDGVPLDLAGPVIVTSTLAASCTTGDRTVTAGIADLSGVPVTGSLQPRIYYNKNSGSFVSSQGVLSSGTAVNGVWTFTISSSALSGITSGDVINYFVVAQDLAPTPNLGADPGAGFAATDVNNVTANPTTPFSYIISVSLNGTYTVGSGGNFTTLTDAANTYNNACITGPVTYLLTDALYSSAETLPIVFLDNPQANASFSLLIRPANSVSAVVTGTSTSHAAVLKFLNAHHITVDGINSGGSNLTVINPNTGNSAAIWLASTASTGPGNNMIGIKNLSIFGGGNTTATNYGIMAGGDGTTPGTAVGIDNDNITIQAVSIERVYRAVFALGSAAVSTGGLDNWLISGNLIGPAASGTNNVAGIGIFMNGAISPTIEMNHVRNISAIASATTGGIGLLRTTSATVVQNTVNSVTSSSTPNGVNAIMGINIGNLSNNCLVARNVVSGISNTNVNGYGARGLILNNATDIDVQNNMISDVWGYGDESAIYWPIGIALEGSTGNVNLDFNSVSLFGAHPGLVAETYAAAIYVNANGGTLRIRNNIFSNTYDNTTSGTDSTFGIYCTQPNSVFSAIDHNCYYAAGNAAFKAAGHLVTAQPSLSDIQTAFGGNMNSVVSAPLFAGNTDLHLQPAVGNVTLHNSGSPVAGIGVDIDLQSRSATTPDIGADEFTIPSCTVANAGVLTPATATSCAGGTVAATAAGANSGLGSAYQWKFSTISGGPYVNVPGGDGATTISYTSAPLAAGVYYIVMTSTCAAISASATSNEGTLTVHAIPTVSASASSASICSGNSVSLSGSASAGNVFMWNGPGGYTSSAQNPVLNNVPFSGGGTYYFVASNQGCASPSASVNLIVEATPSSVTVTPASTMICAGDSAVGVAQGGIIPSIANFTQQVNQNTSSTYPAPYSQYYGGQKMQFLVLAGELANSGLVAGPLTAIQFPVVSMGANWGASLMDLQNFQVSIGHTSSTSVGANFATGLTVVSPAANFTPVIGYGNTHVFSTPFNWDGVSNIIVETVFSHNVFGASADHVIQYNSPTTFQSTMLYRADNQSFATIAAATTTNSAVNLQGIDFKLHGTGVAPLTWSPSFGLSSVSAATVNASPAATTIYTVTATNAACTAENTVAVNVTQKPVINVTALRDTLCAGDTTSIFASGANTYTWNTNQTTPVITVTANTTTMYTVSSVEAPCAVVSETVVVVAMALPQVSITPSTTMDCVGSVVSLTAAGASSYTWSNATNTGATTGTLAGGTNVFSVTGTDQYGCSDDETIAITGLFPPPVTFSVTGDNACAGSPFTYTGTGAITYSLNGVPVAATGTFIPDSSGVYTMTGTDNFGCVGNYSVIMQIYPLPSVGASAERDTICISESVNLDASGALNYSWSAGAGTGTSVNVSPAATIVYTVTGADGNGCVNTATVIVIVDECTGLDEINFASQLSLYPNPTAGTITVDVPFAGSKHFVVMSSSGAVVATQDTNDTRLQLDLSGFAKGIYFVRITNEGNTANIKVVVD